MTYSLNRRSAASVFAVLLVTACGGEAPDIAVDTSARPVKLISIAGTSDQLTARFPAVISAGQEADLSFLVGGIIEELPVSDSADVVAGDLIARLDARDFQSSLSSAQASFDNAEQEYQRAARLAAQDAIATNVLQQRKAQRDVTKAQLETAQKALADSVLRAPFTGVIANVPVRQQQTVSAGATVATLIDVTQLDATINLPASFVAQVPAREDRGAIVFLDVAPDRQIAATFREADLVADATSQTYAVTFTFKGPEDLLVLPGMNATVVLTSRDGVDTSSSVSVPLAAVQSDGDGQYVWLVDPESMTVSRRNIEVAPGIGETIEVTVGLEAGQQIVGAGGAYLAEGVAVTPWVQ